jgi:hypothetical protein
MRKSFDGLLGIVANLLAEDPLSGQSLQEQATCTWEYAKSDPSQEFAWELSEVVTSLLLPPNLSNHKKYEIEFTSFMGEASPCVVID